MCDLHAQSLPAWHFGLTFVSVHPHALHLPTQDPPRGATHHQHGTDKAAQDTQGRSRASGQGVSQQPCVASQAVLSRDGSTVYYIDADTRQVSEGDEVV
jgi:hypothetical protein